MTRHRIGVLGLVLGCVACAPGDQDDPAAESSSTDAADPSSSSTSSVGGDTSSSSSGAPDPDSSSSESSTGEPTPTCTLPDGSPPSVMLEGVVAVPIDALAVQATLRFDASTETATGTAALQFRVGPEGGLPLFDLRQHITAARIDGETLGDPAAPELALGEDPEATIRVLNAELEPCSEHTLELEYDVVKPPDATFPIYDPDGIVWHSDFVDVRQGRYLEMWIPSNLPHDELDIVLDVEVAGTDAEHLVAANGEVVARGDGRWTITFPPHYSALSPLVTLTPMSITTHTTELVQLVDGTEVTIEIVRLPGESVAMEDLVASTAMGLDFATLELGEYPHGDHYLLFASGLIGGMEYPGGTASSPFAIGHEAFHSWIARGIRPLRHRDGWIDEAWTTLAIDLAYSVQPLDARSPMNDPMAPDDPWLRATPFTAYSVGPNMLAMFAEVVGMDELRGSLREFYTAHAGEQVTTEQMHTHLAAAVNAEFVDWAFERFVVGHD